MTQHITSQDFYSTLQAAVAEASQRISDATGKTPRMIIWCNYNHQEIEIEITGEYGGKTEVKGKDLWQCVDEFIRREGFAKSQSALLLGAPILDSDTEF